MTRAATLVFPVSTPEGRAYLDAALARREPVVAASCDPCDPIAGKAPWRRLPLVHESGFLPALRALIQEHTVGQMFAGAHMVHAAVSDTVRMHGLDLRIVNASTIETAYARWDDIFARAETWRSIILAIEGRAPDLPFLAGAIRLAFDLFGESYDDKLAAMLACLLSAPGGDIVEIGTLFGRSASVLLAGRALGSAARRVIVFDPWSAEIGAQSDLPDALKAYTARTDFDTIARAFEATFAAIAPQGAFAAFRAASAEGRAWYAGAHDLEHVRLKSFDAIAPAGAVALLHIDGNHDSGPAMQDVDLWSPLVAPGGWCVIDDYCWRYGEGPRRAGDALLARWGDKVARAFVVGGCLFVQRGP
ncbi:MAG: class I SAM-dependent methyltransferase [Hyphomonadaceae bacterium]|nr:class I SAM-dependent methyltransferase [Hyphomonadaceae bacterium]